MQTISRIVSVLGIAVLISTALPVYAEPAPVYDADSMPMDNVGSFDQPSPDMAPAPAGQEMGQGQENTFQPMRPMHSPGPSVSAESGLSSGTEQRLKRMEQQLKGLQHNEASAHIESLQNEVQTLRGQVEELTHQLQQVQNQQKSMYSDLDKRLAQQKADVNKHQLDMTSAENDLPADTVTKPTKIPSVKNHAATGAALSGASAATKSARKSTKSVKPKMTTPDSTSTEAAAAPSSNSGQPNVAEEQQIYQTAYNYIKAKKYNDAVNALQGMLRKYPSGQFASNAHYWLGELYGLMGKNDQALTEFDTVVKTYPDSPRVSDAQLKIGLLLAAQFKWADARSAFKKVVNNYPGSASAKLAQEQIKQIKLAGH